MRITGTKKIIIILLALSCVLATGVGVMFKRAEAPSVSYAQERVVEEERAESGREDASADSAADEGAQEEEEEYDERYDEGVLNSIADRTGIKFEYVDFYARSMEITAAELEEFVDTDLQTTAETILAFNNDYEAGYIDLDAKQDRKSAASDDMLLPPDGTGEYASGYTEGLQTALPIEKISASKPITNETELWGSSAYTIFGSDHWGNQRNNLAAGEAGRYYFVWLEPGESYTFSVYDAIGHSSVTYGAYDDTSHCFYRVLDARDIPAHEPNKYLL